MKEEEKGEFNVCHFMSVMKKMKYCLKTQLHNYAKRNISIKLICGFTYCNSDHRYRLVDIYFVFDDSIFPRYVFIVPELLGER